MSGALSAYPNVENTVENYFWLRDTLTPEMAATIEPVLVKLFELKRKVEPGFSGDSLPAMLADAVQAEFMPFPVAKDLMLKLGGQMTYADYRLGGIASSAKWGKVDGADLYASINEAKKRLDKREPDVWLPNQPDLDTLMAKVIELKLEDDES